MNNTPDFTKTFEDMFSAFPMDMKVFEDAFKTSTELSGKLSKIAIEAAEKNAELAQAWSRDAFGKLETVTEAQKDPADYSKAFSAFTSSQAQAAPEHIAAFAEVAKKAQTDAVELVLSAGKTAQNEAAAAVKNATKKVA